MRPWIAAAFIATAVFFTGSFGALAQDRAPPEGAKPLSEILRTIEARPDFHYFNEIEFEKGVYEIDYYTRAGAEVRLKIDPMTGNPR